MIPSPLDGDLRLEDPRFTARRTLPRFAQSPLVEDKAAGPATRGDDDNAMPGGARRSDHVLEILFEITAREALQRDLKVMDATALALCMENHLNIHVFNMADESNINRIISGDRVGTLVTT